MADRLANFHFRLAQEADGPIDPRTGQPYVSDLARHAHVSWLKRQAEQIARWRARPEAERAEIVMRHAARRTVPVIDPEADIDRPGEDEWK